MKLHIYLMKKDFVIIIKFSIVNFYNICYNINIHSTHRQTKDGKGFIPKMKKRLTTVMALLLCVSMALCLSSCGKTDVDEDVSDFVAATIPVSANVPVSKQEIIDFYNDIISKVQDNTTFTSENRPGVKTNESLRVGDLKILAFNKATGTATESDSLKSLNKSAKAIKDRILGGIDLSIPVVPFGDMNTSVADVIYPYDSAVSAISAEDVVFAECNVDSNNLNVYLKLSSAPETIDKVFGIRDKASIISDMNSHSSEYAEIQDYTLSYVNDAENDVYSSIYLSVEVEKQEDGTFVCTGRITSLDIKIISDVSAEVEAKGSFADSGDLQVNFRLTDEKYYEFDWLGTSTWEVKPEDTSK